MKLLIAALLAVFSTNVLAEWTRLGSADNVTIYADLSTIRKSGDKVKMWHLMDEEVVKIDKNDGTRYLSQASQNEYDCKEETARRWALVWYSRNMGHGEVVYTSGAMHEEPRPVPPDSVLEALFKLACAK